MSSLAYLLLAGALDSTWCLDLAICTLATAASVHGRELRVFREPHRKTTGWSWLPLPTKITLAALQYVFSPGNTRTPQPQLAYLLSGLENRAARLKVV